ncbi:helix-turn-helix domain-containing protein [Flavobacterium sp. 3HN19-14]|uniref:helix-turn-helix domain-containing protein n=1 Tax=Flavobacterium sp. 3HN19-14 TaxID=3448133 RepID=UPI003EDE909C
MTKIEQHIIEKIKQMRKERDLSQLELSQKLDMNDSFISHVEAPSKRAKYNINHLNKIAEIFDCSPKDFWPEKFLPE